MPSSVRDVDRGYKKLGRTLSSMARKPRVVRIGVQGAENNEPRDVFGTSNIELALVHEFGSRDGRVPQRSFIRSTVDRERQMFERLLQRAARMLAEGTDEYVALGQVGEVVKSEMVRTIDETIGLKPLAQVTIDRKGSTVPLDDTGQMKNSISWVLES